MTTTRHVSANSVRVPNVAPGHAVIVDRYSDAHPKAVVIHPDDFALLQAARAVIEAPFRAGLPEPTELEVQLHRTGEIGGDEIAPDTASMLAALGE